MLTYQKQFIKPIISERDPDLMWGDLELKVAGNIIKGLNVCGVYQEVGRTICHLRSL